MNQIALLKLQKHPRLNFGLPWPWGVGVRGRNPAMNLSAVEKYPRAKYHQNHSSSLDLYQGHMNIYTDFAFYKLDYADATAPAELYFV